MFSPAFGRVVRSSSSIPASSTCSLGRVAAAQQTLAPVRTQQRRLSSSKASIPPNRSNGTHSEQQTAGAGATKVASKKVAKAGKKKTAAPALNVPSVPPTDHLEKPQVKLSSFFSLHRPISVNSAIPPVSSSAAFDSIFQVRPPHNRRNLMDNISTLSGGIESLEAALRGQGLQTSSHFVDDTHHLDGPPQISIEELMARFVPFNPPPAPVPFEQDTEADLLSKQQTEPVVPVKQRFWSTGVVVTESTDSTGNRTYSTTTTPMVEIDAPAAENSPEMGDVEVRQPFLERMRQRQNNTRYRDSQRRPDMLAISVKRQRKLKMKKHKYKKLMKRTRLLRRKLDRL